MISSTLQKFIKILSYAKGFSRQAVLTSSKQVSQGKNYPKLLPLYKVDLSSQKKKKNLKDKKPRKKRIVIKRVSDDIEAVWLENLNISNLELFRKTSYGSFRRVNLESLLLRLKEIYPSTFKAQNCPEITPPPLSKLKTKQRSVSAKIEKKVLEEPSEPVKDTNYEDDISSPCLSDFFIKNIVHFPLLKSSGSVTEYAELEAENFGDVDVQTYPSVTGILNDTMPVEAKMRLKNWKKRMTEELGEEGFMKYQRDLMNQGSKFHSTVKTYLEVCDKNLVTVPPEVEGCWKSVEKILPDVSDVIFTEESVYHPVLKYKGIVDCVAHYRGVPCVIEWKRSNQIKTKLSSTYDAPLQLCAYLGALPWHKNVSVENGLVVIAYDSGAPANVFQMPLESCEGYWVEWLRRVQVYWMKKSPALVQKEV